MQKQRRWMTSWLSQEAFPWTKFPCSKEAPGHISCQTREWGSRPGESSPCCYQTATGRHPGWEPPGCILNPQNCERWYMVLLFYATKFGVVFFFTQQSITASDTFARRAGGHLLGCPAHHLWLLLKQRPWCVFSLTFLLTRVSYKLLFVSILMHLEIFAGTRNV